MNSVEVVPARPGDLELVLSILREAGEWLQGRGINQWNPAGLSAPRVAAAIERGEVYLVQSEGETVGTVTLQWSDPVIWGDAPGAAGYVHGLAIRRAFAGRGLGLQVLRWAEEEVRRAGGDYLRLDCMGENRALRAYYERAGFQFCREISGKGWKAALYERTVD